MDPPLRLESSASLVSAEADLAPAVALEPATVIVFTTPWELVSTATLEEVSVVFSEVEEVVDELDEEDVLVELVVPPAVLVMSLPVIET